MYSPYIDVFCMTITQVKVTEKLTSCNIQFNSKYNGLNRNTDCEPRDEDQVQ